ncbi:MAG: type IV pilus assembly protein PilW [Methylophagaceae bacterium]|jgi:type IV pilus assembly protein PilW
MSFIQIHNRQRGFTLIELMIALVLGLLLVAGVTQVFVANKQTYRVTDAHSRLQDNARFSLEVLSRDIRSAGYAGCRSIEKMNVNLIANAPVPAEMSADTIITGSEASTSTTWSPALPASLGTVVGGTDVITLQRGTGCGATLTGNVGSSSAQIQVAAPNSCNISAGDILMIADCEDAHIFRATNASTITSSSTSQNIAHSATGNGSTHFCIDNASVGTGSCGTGNVKLYNYDAELFKFSAITYFIRLGTNGNPALWSYDLTAASGASNPSELIEGIENFQVLYGADDNDDDIVDRYVTAKVINDATEWDKVIGAQINILAQTLDTNLTTSSQTVDFNGGTITGTEGRLRRVFSTTIAIRNRVQ